MEGNPQDLPGLNRQFGIPNRLEFRPGPGELATAFISNPQGEAAVALLGAHVLEYIPASQPPVLWMSRSSCFQLGMPIRGGIPVCWPWFGAHPDDPSKPMHGFVRTMPWQVYDARSLPGDVVQLTLGLTDSPASRVLFPYSFDVRLTVRVGSELEVSLWMRNLGEVGYTVSGALHSYFSVGDAGQIQITGLDGVEYLDKVDLFRRKSQKGVVVIDSQTDRIYLDTDSETQIHDPVLKRVITISKTGSHTTVVWNPWADRARAMPDFGDDEYTAMVCVETANAANDVVYLPPGGEKILAAVIRSSLIS
jgi:glucose-6-phosphate 1-epimerase